MDCRVDVIPEEIIMNHGCTIIPDTISVTRKYMKEQNSSNILDESETEQWQSAVIGFVKSIDLSQVTSEAETYVTTMNEKLAFNQCADLSESIEITNVDTEENFRNWNEKGIDSPENSSSLKQQESRSNGNVVTTFNKESRCPSDNEATSSRYEHSPEKCDELNRENIEIVQERGRRQIEIHGNDGDLQLMIEMPNYEDFLTQKKLKKKTGLGKRDKLHSIVSSDESTCKTNYSMLAKSYKPERKIKTKVTVRVSKKSSSKRN